MGRDERDDQPQHVNRSEQAGPADIVQARDVHGGVHFHSWRPADEQPPQQLPGDVRHFVNRHDELDDLDALLSGDTESLVVITGTAGVGKTSLALRWAHRVRQRFPDGQLYVNLRGYDPGPPMTPAQALDRFLRALGVRPAAIPPDAEERAALFRSRLADRQMLLILDNAATGSQVRPLLPGTASCLVIVTSRNRLSGLVARDGGRRLTLNILPEPDAVALLKNVTDDYRDRDAPEHLQELASLCARLPLALRIAAERAASRPFMPLLDLIQDLRDESALWDALTADDDEEADAVRTVFAWSYRALAEDAARLFRLLGLHPGSDFSTAAATALMGEADRIRHLLDVLVGANLLEQTGPDRYQLHDLLRAYATDQVRLLEADEQRHAALSRVLNWYLHTADSALATLMPLNRTVPITEPAESAPLQFATETAASTWFEVERENLVTVTTTAQQNGFHQTAWQLAAVLRSVFMHQNAFEDWMATAHAGLAGARAAHNRYGEAEILESLGKAHFQARHLAEAEEHHLAALQIRQEIGNRFGEAVSTNALGLLGLRRRRLDQSLDYFRQSLAIFHELGNRRWEALISSNLAETLYELGHLHEAVSHLDRALAIQREIGDRAQEGNSLHFLSMAQRELGQTTDALHSIEAALDIAHDAQNSVWLAHWLVEYARVLRATGRPAEALDPLQRAAVIQRTLGDHSREATTLDCTGETYRELGQPEEALKFHLQAAKTHRELGDHWHLAIALNNLATALTDTGRPNDARQHWQEANALLTQFPDPRATAVQRHIEASLAS